MISSVQYNGLTTTSVNPQGQNATRITNVMGWVTQSKDHLNNTVNYTYDADGNMTKVVDPAGNTTTMTYDLRGNKTSMTDPDLGYNQYTYNTLGLLTQQQYGGGQTINITYDLLDRKVSQIEKLNASTIERSLSWKYDVGNKGIGKISADSINGTLSKQYTYDNFGRLSNMKNKIESSEYNTTYEYDPLGRLKKAIYPTANNFQLRYDYDDYGHLKSICQPNSTNGNCATIFWQLDSINNRGQATKYTLGNGLKTRKQYDPNTGYLLGIQTGNDTSYTLIQDLAYQYSLIGNLTQRKDKKFNLTEDFQYDVLNRLTQTQVVGQTAVTIQYNNIGNITSKSNVGTYTYGEGGAGPHMVTSINHDGIPNCFYGSQESILYNTYQYPATIYSAQDSTKFTYGSGREKETQKYIKNGALQWSKHYVNGMVEKITEGNTQKTLLYIQAMGETVAMLKLQNNAPDTLRYMHYDHLGSLQAISTSSGVVESVYSNDAWGKQRNPYTWEPILANEEVGVFQRRFTWHESMPMGGLIHMNARLYDPAIGRFTSADPIVQDPTNLQSLNRASYVMNNPLTFTDPSGFFSLKKAFKKAGNFFKENIGSIVSIAIGIALAPATGGMSLGYAIASGAAAGFGGAFVGTLANGGDIGDAFKNGLRGGVIGGISAGLTYGVGSAFADLAKEKILTGAANLIAKSAVHGVVQGGISEATGGSFRDGLISGFSSSIVGSFIRGIENHATRVFTAAIAGGTISEISGGNFANGALTGAFIELYNDSAHPDDESSNYKMRKAQKGLGIFSDIFDAAHLSFETLGDALNVNHGEFKTFTKYMGRALGVVAFAEASAYWKAGDYDMALVKGGIATIELLPLARLARIGVYGGGLAIDYFIDNPPMRNIKWDYNYYGGNHQL